jgi:tetratricopeptide (TPR) repeat protein
MKCPKCQFKNPAGVAVCGKCGSRILADIPDSPESGTGPRNSELGTGVKGAYPKISVTRTLETTPEGLGKGELFAGRFELIEELGTGGMGVVYRAYDKEIGEEIALKILHPDIALDQKTVDRFRNEIKLARRITHKNVCRMHELHQDGKQLFITMEYVPGQDLKGLIKESGALSAGKAISIAKQVAEGLAEAHDLGIIHRDLKPQNIMVDKDGSAKVMDFGIARSLRTAGMTAEGMIIGTPEYMAPEQVEGQEADQRTDIYALGAILFETATGRVPFEGDSPLSVAYKHKNEQPLPPRKLNAEIPEPLNGLILRCLEKEKENRYQTADEVLADLVRLEDGLPISERVILKARPTIRIAREKPTGLKHFFIPALVVLAFIVAGAIAWRFLLRKGPPAKIENSIAVISFTNLTGEKDLDHWTRGIPELFITNLGNTGYFQVTTWERMRDILKQMGKKDVDNIDSDLGFELCRRAGIESLVTGTLTKAGDTFALDVRVLDAETKELRKSAASRGKGEESILSTQVDELSRAIAEGLGTPKEKIDQAQFQAAQMTTASPEAWRLFIIGTERSENLDMDKAAEYFERAIKIDPSFAMAYHELGMAYLTIGKPVAAREVYAKAMELSGRASEKDRLTIEASHAQYVERDVKRATAIREELVRRYPDDKWMHFWLGFIYYQQNRPTDAARAFEKCLELDPEFGIAANHLGLTFLELAEFEKALEATKRYIAIAPGEADPWYNLGDVYITMGKVEPARQSAQSFADYQAKTRPGSRKVNVAVERLFLSGLCDLKAGQFEAARSKLEEIKSILQDVSGELKEILAENISLLQMEIDLAEGAIEGALSYLERNDSYVRKQTSFSDLIAGYSLYTVINSNWTQFREGLARAYEKKGDVDKAIAEYERLVAPNPAESNSLIYPRFYYSLGKLYEKKGAKDKARRRYERFLELWKDADPGTPEVEDAKARLASL